ncbi:hypothetical protein M3Y99_01845400 [Aphelenchoides fujianensis]|nr:hypothetical protein M3Y99_01845400 [Aphelenchoides fujianensis]
MVALRSESAASSSMFVLLLVVLGLALISAPTASAFPAAAGHSALVPETDLYLRFRKNTPNNRPHRSEEYIHPFIRFRKSFPSPYKTYESVQQPAAVFRGEK